MSKIARRLPFVIYLLVIALLMSCSAPRYVTLNDVEKESEVKIYTAGGKVLEGIITEKSDSGIVLTTEKDHEPHTLSTTDIRRIEKSDKNYDFRAHLISDAEIEKYKSNRNGWGYAVGGIFLGGLAGILVGLPFWYADAGIPPYFTGGIGAVAGSIFFGAKGIKKDREIAIETVRYLRKKDREFEDQKASEEQRIKELREETEKLKEKLKKKDQEKQDKKEDQQ